MNKDKLSNILGEDNFNISDKKSQKKGNKKEKLDHKKPLTDSEKIKSKADGAVAEVSRQAERDKTTEASYSTELNTDLSFIEDSSKIDDERKTVVDNLATTVIKIAATTELKDTETESFGAANVELNKKMEEMMANYEAEDTVDREVVIPDHVLAEQKLENEKQTNSLLDTLYAESTLEETDKDVSKNQELNNEELLDVLSQGASMIDSKNSLDSEQIKLLRKINTLNLSEEQKREMLSNIPKQKTVDALDEKIEDNKNIEQHISNSGVVEYAKKMGINAEELERNKEFTELNSAQQQFILEALNRTSLCKIKVEAHQNFLTEKENKKWYHLGFALNQKFHKKKHEVLAAKDIHEKGLEGYGETELSWLISVIKNGPEIKIDEEGDLKSIDYLKIESGLTPERQTLIEKYNDEAYFLSRLVPGSKGYEGYLKDVEVARDALLLSARDDQDGGADLVNKLVDAEKQLKLHQFLSSDYKNEKIIQNLIDNSLGSWQKFGMMMGGQSDKAKYMGVGMGARVLLRGEIATSFIGKGLSYAIGPVVAAAMGAWRSNSNARAGLKEEAELSKIGIASDNKLVKSLNLAVGSKESDGKIINIGLADKLENLIEKHNLVENRINELLSDYRDEKQTEELENLKTEKIKLSERLIDRINYTSAKMDDGLVSFGAPENRATNYYKLLNSVEEAKTLVFYSSYILDYKPSRPTVYQETVDLTRTNKKIKDINNDQEFQSLKQALLAENLTPEVKEDLEAKKKAMVRAWYRLDELNDLSVADRLASFLDFKEEERQSAEFKYLVKETTKGAVIGATFAAVGAWIFEHTGLGNWTSTQLNNLGHAVHLDQAVSWTKGLFSSDDINNSKVAEKVSAAVIQEKVINLPKTEITETSTAEKVASTNVSKVAEVAKENIAPKTYSEKISSEPGKSNSVWRSLREIFKSNSQELGYKGDINDTEALNRWSESQTANAIHNSGEVTDKVFEGNKISLVEENGQFKVNVEAGEGEIPDYLSHEPIAETTPEVVSKPDLKEMVSIKPSNIISPVKVSDIENPVVSSNQGVVNEMAKVLHVESGTLKSVGNEVIYQNKSGRIIFDASKNIIKEVFDANNKPVPQEFINELRGNTSLEKFASRNGLEKIFSTWNKLGASDKTIYESLRAFNLNKLTPFDLINKISGTFNVVAKDVMVDVDAKHFILGNQEFNMNAEGVHKLVRVLTRRFGA